MHGVRIVTDSTADLPPQLAKELGITVVPCEVHLGGQSFLDGVDMTPQEFYRRWAQNSARPRTSQPPVRLFVESYSRLLDGDATDCLLSIHIAASLSGTVNAAWAAAQTLDDPERVEVIDTGQLSMGAGWAVIHAARMAQDGAPRAEVSRAVHSLLPRLRAAAMIDSLEHLHRGGRISQISALIGTALQIKPLLSIQDGRLSVWERARSRAKALLCLADHVRSWGALAEAVVLHTGNEAGAQNLAAVLADGLTGKEIAIQPAGAALATHLGLGAVGACALLA